MAHKIVLYSRDRVEIIIYVIIHGLRPNQSGQHASDNGGIKNVKQVETRGLREKLIVGTIRRVIKSSGPTKNSRTHRATNPRPRSL